MKKRVFVIAEASCNHNGSFENAVKLIKRAKQCGANAIKFQAFKPDLITLNIKNRYFRCNTKKWGTGKTLYDIYKAAYTPWEWFPKLKKVADDIGIVFFATSFDKTAVDFLEKIKVSMHKISSFELVDLPLIEHVASTKKPLIMSTGMASFRETQEAHNVAKKVGAKDITLLKCDSDYPANSADMNLITIADMKKQFGCKVGLSDHTLGTEVAIAAVAMGAVMIEKHFMLSRKCRTLDSFFSIEPREFKEMVASIRVTEQALGSVHYGLTKGEKKSRTFKRRRSLFAIEDIPSGALLSELNMRSIRPAHGLSPKFYKSILGNKVKKNLKKGTPITIDCIDK